MANLSRRIVIATTGEQYPQLDNWWSYFLNPHLNAPVIPWQARKKKFLVQVTARLC